MLIQQPLQGFPIAINRTILDKLLSSNPEYNLQELIPLQLRRWVFLHDLHFNIGLYKSCIDVFLGTVLIKDITSLADLLEF